MTYCVGILVNDGLVFASDTRTSASFDDIRVHNKMHVFDFPGDRVLTLMSAGHLGTTQSLVARLEREVREFAPVNLRSARHLFEVADYVGRLLVEAQQQAMPGNQTVPGLNLESTLILGGQIGTEPPGLFLIYPQGNAMAASPETPYLQIGESKYGKPVLEQVLRADTSLEDAARCALVSLDATIRCNVSVGLPIDLLVLRSGDLNVGERLRLGDKSPLYTGIQRQWTNVLTQGIRSLDRMPWGLASTDSEAATSPSAGTM